jgi:catechol 2,3-dioxygenase-like lactoylglutathione lyase family enzyme
MTITLNHAIVPTRDKRAAAQFFARIFGLHADSKGDHFAPVRINDTLTLLFDDEEKFESHHYAFHVQRYRFSPDGVTMPAAPTVARFCERAARLYGQERNGGPLSRRARALRRKFCPLGQGRVSAAACRSARGEQENCAAF